jgi:hypothetical protein
MAPAGPRAQVVFHNNPEQHAQAHMRRTASAAPNRVDFSPAISTVVLRWCRLGDADMAGGGATVARAVEWAPRRLVTKTLWTLESSASKVSAHCRRMKLKDQQNVTD